MDGLTYMPTDRTSIFGVFRGAGEQHRFHREVLHMLRQEREDVTRVMQEHRRSFVRVRMQARRDGRRLLKVLDRLPRPV